MEAIGRTGSLSQAARSLAMSYRRAWLLINSMNAGFDTPVISAAVGGSGGGGATLTPFGKALIDAWRALEARLAPLTVECMGRLAAHAAGSGSAAAARSPRKTLARSLKRGDSR